jgi:hypothetical protein
MDIIRVDVPTFLRLLELAREDVKDDMSLHFVTEKAIELSKTGLITMDDYDEIIAHMRAGKQRNELEDIRRLGGLT